MAVVIDSHQHYWDLSNTQFDYSWLEHEELSPIRRSFFPRDLKPLIEQAGVHKTVFVQTQHNVEENLWVLDLAEQHDFIAGVVGWVDLVNPQCEDQLLRFRDHPKFVGIRHVTQDEPDDNFIIRDDVVHGLRLLEKHGVPFDLLFHDRHLHHVPTLAQRLPDLQMVINHLSKPRIKEKRLDVWAQNIKNAAKYPNIHCKLSGLVTEADWKHWTVADLGPFVQTVLETFGADRCMFGSDWPVCELAATYGQVYDALSEALGPISDGERSAIFGGTATRYYGLDVPDS